MGKLLTFLYVFSFHWIYGQDFKTITAENEITTIAYWKSGDARKYHVVKDVSKFKKDSKKPFSNEHLEYDLNLRILKEEDSSYLIEMVYSNYRFPNKTKENEMIQKFTKLSEGLKILYVTDEIGIYDSIANKEDLTEILNEQLDKLLTSLETTVKKESDKELLNILIEHYKDLFSKPENIDVLFAEDILRIHGYYGLQMKVAKPVEIEMYYPALNNFLLNGTGTVTLNDINKSTKAFTFIAMEEPNADELKNYLKEIFQLLTMGMKQKEFETVQFDFDTNTKHRFTMDLRSCWLIKSTHTSVIKMRIDKSTSRTVSKTTVSSL